MTTKTRVLNVARSQLGTVELPPGSNRTKYGEAYGMDGHPWCAMFWWWCFKQSGPMVLFPKSAYTPAIWDWYRAQGRTGLKPQVGALAFMDFPGDSVNRISHIGMVEKVNADGSVICIEANTSPGVAGSQRDGGGVYRRQRRVGIVGYAYPAYMNETVVTTEPASALRTIQKGSTNTSLNKYLQTKLNTKYPSYSKLVVDGDFGDATEKVVMEFQRRSKLKPDGIVGPVTWSKL